MVCVADLNIGATCGAESPVIELDWEEKDFFVSRYGTSSFFREMRSVLSVIFDKVPFLSMFRAIRLISEGVAVVGRPLKRI